MGIFVLNFLLGWTFIGWVVALVWSFSSESNTEKTLRVSSYQNDDSQKRKIGDIERLDNAIEDIDETAYSNLSVWEKAKLSAQVTQSSGGSGVKNKPQEPEKSKLIKNKENEERKAERNKGKSSWQIAKEEANRTKNPK